MPEDPSMRKLRKAIHLKNREVREWRSAFAANRAGLPLLAGWHERNAEDARATSNELLYLKRTSP